MDIARYKIMVTTILFAVSLSFIVSQKEIVAADQRVSVELPSFEVVLNGNKIDNQYREYPLFVYKDITYVPMTWYDSRLLGLETEWESQSGLSIKKGKVVSTYEPYHTKRRNSNRLQATIPNFDITVNGEEINNAKEKYPLLSYHNITYFPLTWRFAHDEFGWAYEWDQSKGLIITSDNPKIRTIDLPKYAWKNDVALFQGYYYFTETSNGLNQVYRVPENNLSLKELVYSVDADQKNQYNNYMNFQIRDDELWFSYHVGGATMGSNVYVKIDNNGKGVVEQRGYLDFKTTPYGTLIIDQSVPPAGNNLLLKPLVEEGKSGKSIGDPSLIYGWQDSGSTI